MNFNKKRVSVKIPHRISGFFEIVDSEDNKRITSPERIGSRGAGFNLGSFGTTTVSYRKNSSLKKNSCKVHINGEEKNHKAGTTNFVFDCIRDRIANNAIVSINHEFDLPVGCGYGASGSGALGAIYGLDALFGLSLSPREKGRIAHIAEVENKTGLGTVCGQLSGGMSILMEPGYPCTSKRITVSPKLRVVCGTFGLIETKSILSDPVLKEKINDAGKRALKMLVATPNITTFLKASIKFVQDSNILDLLNLNDTRDLMDDLNNDSKILGASMNQLGRSVYAFCKEGDLKEVIERFESYKPNVKIFDSVINDKVFDVKFE